MNKLNDNIDTKLEYYELMYKNHEIYKKIIDCNGTVL